MDTVECKSRSLILKGDCRLIHLSVVSAMQLVSAALFQFDMGVTDILFGVLDNVGSMSGSLTA